MVWKMAAILSRSQCVKCTTRKCLLFIIFCHCHRWSHVSALDEFTRYEYLGSRVKNVKWSNFLCLSRATACHRDLILIWSHFHVEYNVYCDMAHWSAAPHNRIANRTGFSVYVVLVLNAIRYSCHYFLYNILFYHDFHHDSCDYHWDFYGH